MSGRQARARRRHERTPMIELSAEQEALVEAAMELDRAYFRAHPDADWYIRPRQPGEHTDGLPYSMPVEWTHTLVRQIGEGVRMRYYITEHLAGQLAGLYASGGDVVFPDDEISRGLRELVARRDAQG
jgi:hypothetical protein